jgi:DNA modification methylase
MADGRPRKLNGWDSFPVVFQDFKDDQEEYTCVQSDNAIAHWAELDLPAINEDMLKIKGDFDVDLLGIKDFALTQPEKAGKCDEDEVPEPIESIAKMGDIWKLGQHRLMCGDSTSIDAVEKLMAGEKADLWLTDPPYGVGMEARERSSSFWVNKNRVNKQITNDDKPIEEMKGFWKDCAASAFAACSDKSAYYWFACQGGDQMMMMMMSLGDGGWQVKHELMWLKDQMVFGRADYHYKHEPILYGWKRGGTHEWYGDRKQTSVVECKRPRSSVLHPTMKPIELLEPLLSNSTKQGQAVLDLFGGSGSTLIACEKTSRKCFMMEIDPHYCDVIIARWEKYTGKKAELTNGQATKKVRRKPNKAARGNKLQPRRNGSSPRV